MSLFLSLSTSLPLLETKARNRCHQTKWIHCAAMSSGTADLLHWVKRMLSLVLPIDGAGQGALCLLGV